MLKLSPLFLACALVGAVYETVPAEPIGGTPIFLYGTPTVPYGDDISVAYLLQARSFRDQGRYELARQSYAQALSTCRNTANLEVIKRELAGVELLIRTMR